MRYRHKTFFSKEPETIKWIDGFNKGSTFFDIGANIGYILFMLLKLKTQMFMHLSHPFLI